MMAGLRDQISTGDIPDKKTNVYCSSDYCYVIPSMKAMICDEFAEVSVSPRPLLVKVNSEVTRESQTWN